MKFMLNTCSVISCKNNTHTHTHMHAHTHTHMHARTHTHTCIINRIGNLFCYNGAIPSDEAWISWEETKEVAPLK